MLFAVRGFYRGALPVARALHTSRPRPQNQCSSEHAFSKLVADDALSQINIQDFESQFSAMGGKVCILRNLRTFVLGSRMVASFGKQDGYQSPMSVHLDLRDENGYIPGCPSGKKWVAYGVKVFTPVVIYSLWLKGIISDNFNHVMPCLRDPNLSFSDRDMGHLVHTFNSTWSSKNYASLGFYPSEYRLSTSSGMDARIHLSPLGNFNSINLGKGFCLDHFKQVSLVLGVFRRDR